MRGGCFVAAHILSLLNSAARCRADIGGLGSLGSLFDAEFDSVTHLQVVVLAIAGTVVKKDVVRSLDGNKPESYVGLRFDGSCSHCRKKKKAKSVVKTVDNSLLFLQKPSRSGYFAYENELFPRYRR